MYVYLDRVWSEKKLSKVEQLNYDENNIFPLIRLNIDIHIPPPARLRRHLF